MIREGDPKGWSSVLLTALGSVLGKSVPHGRSLEGEGEMYQPIGGGVRAALANHRRGERAASANYCRWE